MDDIHLGLFGDGRAQKNNYLAPRATASILGKLFFLLATGAYFGCGSSHPTTRGSGVCLVTEIYRQTCAFPFTEAMVLMLEFFVALFRDLPPLVIHLGRETL